MIRRAKIVSQTLYIVMQLKLILLKILNQPLSFFHNHTNFRYLMHNIVSFVRKLGHYIGYIAEGQILQ